ncbi:hypothetical protein ACIOGX_00470 [Streptomyces sp. NPDC088147]|uniref:hypothetical protein n=1 Tax=Streptomyces sp. NPDC088147 TaxID=3365830 RepID=UPI0037F79EB5
MEVEVERAALLHAADHWDLALASFPTRRPADPPTRRPADPPTRRPADPAAGDAGTDGQGVAQIPPTAVVKLTGPPLPHGGRAR